MLANNRLTEYKRTECVMWKRRKEKNDDDNSNAHIKTMEIDYTHIFKSEKGKRNQNIQYGINEKNLFLSSVASSASASADSFSSTSFSFFRSVFTLRILNSLHKYRSHGDRHSTIHLHTDTPNTYKVTLHALTHTHSHTCMEIKFLVECLHRRAQELTWK